MNGQIPDFPMWNISKDIFKHIIWEEETMRKKYGVVFEKFPKMMFFVFSTHIFFLHTKKIVFLRFCTKDVLKIRLRGRETIKKE